MKARRTPAQLQRDIDAVLASPSAKRKKSHGRHSQRSHSPIRRDIRRTPYRIKLTPSELRAVEFASGRYAWPDMLAAHAAEDGSIAFTESEMWQWVDDVDSDDGRFTLASPALASKLEDFAGSVV